MSAESSVNPSDLLPKSPVSPGEQNNLPAQTTPFVGREAEISDLAKLIADPNVRLLTLTGAGGIGKTRLAIQVASRAQSGFPDGTWFVALAPLNLPDDIVPTIANTIGLLLRNDEPQRERLL